MKKMIKRHTSFLAWVLLPSLLLVAAVLGVNIVSRPSVALIGSSCNTITGPDCTPLTNSCVREFCSTNLNLPPGQGTCEPENPDAPTNPPAPVGQLCACNDCGNGRCEPAAGEDSTNCPEDCFPPVGFPAITYTCDANTPCGATEGVLAAGPVVTGGFDGCCPGIQCNQPATPSGTCIDAAGLPIPGCDPDCCYQCGDGVVGPGEQCEPGLLGACDVQAGETCGLPGTASACQCVPPLPPSCGDGVRQANEECDPGLLGSCGADPYDVCLTLDEANTLNAQQCGGTFTACTCFSCVIEGSGCGGSSCTNLVSSCDPASVTGGAGLEGSIMPASMAQRFLPALRYFGWAGALIGSSAVYLTVRRRKVSRKK